MRPRSVSSRLLVDLLEHEMFVAAALRHHRAPIDAPRLAVDLVAGERLQTHRGGGELRHLAVLEEDHVAGVAEESGDVAATEHFSLADADDEGRRGLGDHQAIGCASRNDGDRVRALDLADCGANGFEEVRRAGAHGAVDEVGDDFRIGVRREANAIRFERLAQSHVVLDDAVVHDGDVTGRVRVGIVLARTPMRGPARMPDPGRTGQRVFGQGFVEEGELAGGAYDFDGLAVMHGEACRIVTAVFELAEPVDQDGSGRTGSDVADDSAHDPDSAALRPG